MRIAQAAKFNSIVTWMDSSPSARTSRVHAIFSQHSDFDMPSPLTIASTSIGSAGGEAVVDACRLAGLPLSRFGMGKNPFAERAYDSDARSKKVSIGEPGDVVALRQRCHEHGTFSLIPALHAELQPFADHRQAFRADGIEVSVAAGPVVALSADKAGPCRNTATFSAAFASITEAEQPAIRRVRERCRRR